MADVGDLLAKVSAADLRLDRLGRVVITNPDLVRAIRETGDLAPADMDEVAGNVICCGNGSCASPELVGIFERLVSGRAGLTRG